MCPRQEERSRTNHLSLYFACHNYMTVWGKVSYLLFVYLMMHMKGEHWSGDPIDIILYILPAEWHNHWSINNTAIASVIERINVCRVNLYPSFFLGNRVTVFTSLVIVIVKSLNSQARMLAAYFFLLFEVEKKYVLTKNWWGPYKPKLPSGNVFSRQGDT
jgi:hypothetical protein